jgi:hypothetical protein
MTDAHFLVAWNFTGDSLTFDWRMKQIKFRESVKQRNLRDRINSQSIRRWLALYWAWLFTLVKPVYTTTHLLQGLKMNSELSRGIGFTFDLPWENLLGKAPTLGSWTSSSSAQSSQVASPRGWSTSSLESILNRSSSSSDNSEDIRSFTCAVKSNMKLVLEFTAWKKMSKKLANHRVRGHLFVLIEETTQQIGRKGAMW